MQNGVMVAQRSHTPLEFVQSGFLHKYFNKIFKIIILTFIMKKFTHPKLKSLTIISSNGSIFIHKSNTRRKYLRLDFDYFNSVL